MPPTRKPDPVHHRSEAYGKRIADDQTDEKRLRLPIELHAAELEDQSLRDPGQEQREYLPGQTRQGETHRVEAPPREPISQERQDSHDHHAGAHEQEPMRIDALIP